MSQRLSHLEVHQHEMRTSMGFETLEPIVYPPLPPPALEDLWAWYHNAKAMMKTTMMKRMKRSSENDFLPETSSRTMSGPTGQNPGQTDIV
jgi:hypothetical protein